VQDIRPEDKLESMISGLMVHRFDTIAGFIDSYASGKVTFGENGAKVIFLGIYELVHRDKRWYIRRFKSITTKREIEVKHSELLVGQEGEYCQMVWNPSLVIKEGTSVHPLFDYTSREEKEKERTSLNKSVMESLAFI